jgi:peptide/nickel transport system substrate-binding protein
MKGCGKSLATCASVEAVSHALNREEINELVFFGLGTPAQYTGVDPNTVNFVTEEQKTYLTEFDTDKANELLDDMGLEGR